VIMHRHGLAAAVLGSPTPMVSNLTGGGLTDAAWPLALDVAVGTPPVHSHGVVKEGNRTGRAGPIVW
jgi:hypothetical protein